ncbi:Clavaminate synthase-like protein [Guyanagaster necrorhizus]|uniref:Clavaminate synthase-like protein n=1 Tax=Guyanagaster necrorhizus TaxID=856835 RepID=A0A9P7W5W6_9AGAR|nr:Clavaminate synthase-like protein [Guyanagaster necrorhizus MCA 3950]KAG7452789.1 Clavaminate synthase-like protein [Guyanagaster necrorhizus MCA 3950]
MSKSQSGWWRRMHTDASILRALTLLDQSRYLQAIDILDRAIIISGAMGRLDLIHALMQDVQSELASHISGRDFPALSCRRLTHKPLCTASLDVPSLSFLPSLSSFRSQLSSSPFILRGYASDWPALTNRPWRSVGYLRNVAGPGRVVPVEVGKDYRNDDWTQQIMPWDEFLASLESDAPDKMLYLAQHNLFMQFPDLRADIIVPDYVYSAPSALNYVPPGNDEQLVLNTWLGPGGTVSPAHTDPYFNFYVQIVGSKTVWLASPECSGHMYPEETPSISNTSCVDVFTTQDGSRDYPAFWDEVVPKAMSATLQAGDMLFFPPGWWHAMQANETSFSVSMWF